MEHDNGTGHPGLTTPQRRRDGHSLAPLLLTATLLTSAADAQLPAPDISPPPLLLAQAYKDNIPVQDYLISEKLDGVRVWWNGKQLISRGGNVYNAPPWFTADFPEVALDGELWMGRGTFEDLSAAVRRLQPMDSEWRRIRFMVLDLPGSDAGFGQRNHQLVQLLATSRSPWLQVVRQDRALTNQDLKRRLVEVTAAGGEGLMLHRDSSRYRAGRSNDLLKLKLTDDSEARVVAHTPGGGRYQGMMGSLLVETPDGTRFHIGTGFTDQQRRDPPPPGSTITYRYQGHTSQGIPRFASFVRVAARH